MKRILLLMILSCFVAVGFAQTTYYWVGGNNVTVTSLTGAYWSTTPGGTPATRSVNTDILIFDGVNVNFQVAASFGIGSLYLNNAAKVSFASTNGTRTLTLNSLIDALVVSGNSELSLIDGGASMVLALASNSIGRVEQGTVNINGVSGSQRILVPTTGALSFNNGSICNINVSAQYPFSAVGVSGNKSVVFNSGSSLFYKGGRSPFGDTSTGYVVDMKLGSNFVLEANNSTNGFFNSKNFGNVIVATGAAVSLGSDNFSSIDNITINTGGTFLIRNNGVSPVTGNIVNNGTFGVTAIGGSSQLLMCGSGLQTISGNGTFGDLGSFSVAAHSSVKIERNLSLKGASTGVIAGILDLGSNSLTGTASMQLRPSSFPATAVTAVASNTLTLDASKYFSDGTNSINTANVALGLTVFGNGIPNNTYIISTSSTSSSITLSNSVTIAVGEEVTIGNQPVSLSLSNSLGIDDAIALTGSKTFGAGTNYVFNAATISPFSISNGNALGDVTFNAPVTTNRSVTINGKLTLNNSKLTLNESDIITMGSTSSFVGSIGSSSYIATAANVATGTFGKLRLTDVSASTLIPIGTATHYTPVTLNPTSSSTFDINVFAGATTDATPNGTALTAAQKSKMVDAAWNIQRTSGTGNVDVTLGWVNALEGTDFANFNNAQIGVSAYTGGAYTAFTSSGNAAANKATFTTSSFSPFVVGEANTTLPLTLISFTPKQVLNSVKLEWRTTDEVNLKNYVLQHKVGNGFQDIYTVSANNRLGIFNYSYTHLNPAAGVNYYRLVGVDLDGTTHESEVKSIRVTLGSEVAVYPNPVSQRNITVSGVVKGDIIKILNIQGQIIATKITNGNQVEEIDVQNIQAGTYILSIENAGKITSTKKVIKI